MGYSRANNFFNAVVFMFRHAEKADFPGEMSRCFGWGFRKTRLTADYTGLLEVPQSTSGRVRPRHPRALTLPQMRSPLKPDRGLQD
jgi:hypothetical protein